jgi:hypothetical protein
MTDNALRDHFERLVADEPGQPVSLEPVVTNGRRLRRRRRIGLVAGATTTSAVLVAAVAVPLALSRDTTPVDTVAVTPFALTGAQATAPRATTADDLTPTQRRIAGAIRDASPAGWTFQLDADRWDDLNGVEATADDGDGQGRLMIGISPGAGTQQLHPCLDPEFKAGVSCDDRVLPDGSVLSLRGLVDSHGIEYVDVTLTHPDGGGVMAESGNFVITWPLPRVVTADQKHHLIHRSRPAPTYTVDGLAKVVMAIDRALRSND